MGLLLTIVLVIVGLILIAYLAGFILPDHVTMERNTVIDAPRDRVFKLISDFTEWPKWSPWAERDPDAKYTIEGEGVGHLMSWTSDKKDVGNGSQRIVAYDPPSRMESDLNFGDMGTARAIFVLDEAGGGKTNVTWKFDSNMRKGVPVLMQPISTYMGFMMEKFLAPDYEKGLSNLKAAAENGEGIRHGNGDNILNIPDADRSS